MKTKDLITRKIITVANDTTFRELWKIFFKSKINAVPVTDKHKTLLGIITKDDMLKCLYPGYEDLVEDFFSVSDFVEMEKRINELGDKSAKNIMSKKVIYTLEETPIMRALSRMIVRSVNQLPVLSKNHQVVGMITKGDIFKALFKMSKAKK